MNDQEEQNYLYEGIIGNINELSINAETPLHYKNLIVVLAKILNQVTAEAWAPLPQQEEVK